MAPRRSPRLHPQIHASEQDAGVVCRRSPRLHPQNHASDDVAGVTRRRIRRRRGTSPAPAASLPDDDDMLREILVRLPPHPSSLPRASAVCKRWRGVVTDPKFVRQFYAHHGKPSLLGFFSRRNLRHPVFSRGNQGHGVVFNAIPPNRIPPRRFNLGRWGRRDGFGRVGYDLLDCRHGIVLVVNTVQTEVVACDPIARKHCRVAIPPGFKTCSLNGAVLCADGDQGHVHGHCHSSPFKISLAVIEGPPVTNDCSRRIIKGEDGVLGYAAFSWLLFQTWQRSVNVHDVATWVPWKSIEMHVILGLPPLIKRMCARLVGYDEDNGLLLVYVDGSVYTILHMSMQSRKLHETRYINDYYPFTSFYTPANQMSNECLAGLEPQS
ncbi:unnamed protein product [Alopecurus aequalis]